MQFHDKIRQKKGKEKVIMLTAYDYQTAKILDEMQIDMILVGDSLGMVIQGRPDTKSVTMLDMIYHTHNVSRGTQRTPVIGDMPIHSYDTVEDALRNAKLFLDAGAHGVKIEGNRSGVVKALVEEGVPTMGHVGMLPQSAETYKVKGKEPAEAERIMHDAIELDALGVFSIVLECVPESLARNITENVKVPTIGIGAGRHCDGQVLVINDMLGLENGFKPKFVKMYANLNAAVRSAVAKFREEVLTGQYPDEEHTYH